MLRVLVQQGIITKESLEQLIADPKRGDTPVLIYAVVNGAVSGKSLMEWFADRYHLPTLDLDTVTPDPHLLDFIDFRLMHRYWVLPISLQDGNLQLAMANPTDFKAVDDIRFNSGLQVSPILVEADKLNTLIMRVVDNAHGGIDDIFIEKAPSAAEQEAFDLAQAVDALDDAPVVRFVQQLLRNAILREASDIHFEPYEQELRVRYRLDGVLHDIIRPNLGLKDGVTSRLKILCGLDISERRLPQDGRLRVRVPPSRIVDFRVSFLPTNFGETIVLRLLDPASAKVPIEQLGFLPEQRKAFESAIHRPYGMILVTGPTGSGKTVTLYTALNILNTGDCNISTAEDPVEIPMFGINQVNINERIGLNFAAALRSFLRQDPDIIMVGEVRDLETAETAVKAAQTGHLVMATLHTNDAPQSLTRLENMGIPTYNIASSVHLVMAQRLVRKLCSYCKAPVVIPSAALLEAGFAPEDMGEWQPFGTTGCKRCNQTGYKGRIGLFQVMPVSAAMQEMILQGGSALDIARQASAEGVLTMRQAGLKRIMEGITSLDEVLRVTNISL